jgi:predicted NAD/FAD-binding protein
MHLNIGVIGSGMAGLVVGHLFHSAGHQVTIFESATARGMDAHTISVATETGQGLVDAPLRVMSGTGWRSVLALCQELGVSTFPVDTPVSLSWMDQTTWLRTGTWHLGSYSIPTLGALRYLHGDTLRIIRDLARLRSDLALAITPNQDATRLPQFSEEQASNSSRETIEEFFIRRKYAPIFWRGFLLPLLGTITTCRMEHLLRYPARDLLLIVRDIIFGKPLRRIKGGTTALAQQLGKNLTFISGASVTKVTEEAGPNQKSKVVVTNSRGESYSCDRLIVATQANSLNFLGDLCATERTLLRSIEYDHGELFTHTDPALMPRRREDWTPLNYLMDTRLQQNMFTVWVNPVEPTIAQSQPVFQSWNPIVPLRPECILSRVPLQRAVQSAKTAETLAKLSQFQSDPDRRIYFCGSWAAPGVPLLESAVRSAINIAQQFSIEIPWDPVAPSLAS